MTAAVAKLVQEAMREQHIPGLSIAVVKGNETLFCRGYGYANLEWRVPVTPAARFEIASVTKLFTAQAVMLLVQQGRLALSDTIGGYLTDLPDPWRPITLAQMLTHQSGIPNYTNIPAFWEGAARSRTKMEILALVSSLPLRFAPGSRHAYDNTAFYLLGMLIETVSGMRYDQFLKQVIFEPLGMMHTRANDPAEVVDGRAAGYQWTGSVWQNKPYYDPANTFSGGVLLSTAADLARWAQSLSTGNILSPAVQKQMWTPHPSRAQNERTHSFSMGLGWFLVDYQGFRFAGHNGNIVGFASAFMHYLDHGLSVMLLCNVDAVREPHAIAHEIARTFINNQATAHQKPGYSSTP